MATQLETEVRVCRKRIWLKNQTGASGDGEKGEGGRVERGMVRRRGEAGERMCQAAAGVTRVERV